MRSRLLMAHDAPPPQRQPRAGRIGDADSHRGGIDDPACCDGRDRCTPDQACSLPCVCAQRPRAAECQLDSRHELVLVEGPASDRQVRAIEHPPDGGSTQEAFVALIQAESAARTMVPSPKMIEPSVGSTKALFGSAQARNCALRGIAHGCALGHKAGPQIVQADRHDRRVWSSLAHALPAKSARHHIQLQASRRSPRRCSCASA